MALFDPVGTIYDRRREPKPLRYTFGESMQTLIIAILGIFAVLWIIASVMTPSPAGGALGGAALGLLWFWNDTIDKRARARARNIWKSPRHVFETYGHALKDRSLTERLLRKEER